MYTRKAKAKQIPLTKTSNIPNRFPRKVTHGVTKKQGRAKLRRKPHPMK